MNEKGTEATAASILEMELGIDPRMLEPPRQFRADHPFLFLIRDCATGTILFLGRVARPKE